MIEPQVDDGDESVAVDDALDPGRVGVTAGAQRPGGEGEGVAGSLGDGDDLVGLGAGSAQVAGPTGDAKAEVQEGLI